MMTFTAIVKWLYQQITQEVDIVILPNMDDCIAPNRVKFGMEAST